MGSGSTSWSWTRSSGARAARRHDRVARLPVPARRGPADRPDPPARDHPRGALERQPRESLGARDGLVSPLALPLALHDLLALSARIPPPFPGAGPRPRASRSPAIAAGGGGVARGGMSAH